jgi:hypothetical protein
VETDAAFNILSPPAVGDACTKLPQGCSCAQTVEQIIVVSEFGQIVLMSLSTLTLQNNGTIPDQAVTL